MKELTNEEKMLVAKLWDNGYGIHAIAIRIHEKRDDMDAYYLAEMVAVELTGKVSYNEEGNE